MELDENILRKNGDIQESDITHKLNFSNSDSSSEEEELEGHIKEGYVKHSRTPSGTNLTDIVQDIRTIFSSVSKRKREDYSGEKAPKSPVINSQWRQPTVKGGDSELGESAKILQGYK